MANLKETSIKYINKDFEGFKRDLMRYAQAHFSGSYQDYNESSPGMMILEMQAYIGDVLAFYMDQQFLETKSATARQLDNIEDYAKMRGYKPKGKRSARVTLDFIVEVPAKDGSPDPDYLPILLAGSQVQSQSGISFETIEDLDFNKSTPENPQLIVPVPNSDPQTLAVRRTVEAVAGETIVQNFDVGDFTPFYRLKLGSTDVQDVIEVKDAEGNIWYEVDYLAQSAVYDQITNTGEDSDVVPYILRLRSTPRRFVVDKSITTNSCWLQFGGGDISKFDDELIPNAASFAIPSVGKQTYAMTSIDPQNFLKTRSLGLSPYNTRLTVRYRVGGGVNTNVPARTITKITYANLTFSKPIGPGGLDQDLVDIVKNIEVFNMANSSGGGEEETVSEIKANASSFFAAQARAVSKEDFIAHVLSMPERFGRVEKVIVNHSKNTSNGVDIHLLMRDNEGKFSSSTATLKKNVKTNLSQLRMLTKGISIFDTGIINVGIEFGVVVSPKYNRSEVLTNCMTVLKDYFKNDNMEIGMPIVLSDAKAALQMVTGVISVFRLEVVLKRGAENEDTPYATNMNFDIRANTKNGIVFCPANAIFEVRFPDNDIIGESK
jgi:hypothetical protein